MLQVVRILFNIYYKGYETKILSDKGQKIMI